MSSRALIGCVAAGSFIVSAHGNLLNLDLEPSPDLTTGFISISYDADAANLQFMADGFTLSYFDGVSVTDATGGLFMIDMTVDDMGNATGGMLSITGTLPGIADGTLLTGDLTDFGFAPAGGDPLEFLWSVSGGLLADDYGGIGAIAGTILSQTSFPGDWTEDWSGSGAVSDTAPIPAPTGAAILGLGLVATGARRRR